MSKFTRDIVLHGKTYQAVCERVEYTDSAGNIKIKTVVELPEEIKWVEGQNTALKPAYEPVIVCRAPRGNLTYGQCANQYGTGLFNIDGARIATSDTDYFKTDSTPSGKQGGVYGYATYADRNKRSGGDALGRWPSNIILDEHAAAQLDAMSGESSGDNRGRGNGSRPGGFGNIGAEKGSGEPNSVLYADGGGASRFFYTAKASAFEREAGLDYREVTPRSQVRPNSPDHSGKFPDHDARQRRNTHPTVKPIQLNEYFCRLILPPKRDEPRRLLVPFAGVGSEVIGAKLAGWDVVTGIEREAEYVEQGRARIAWWSGFKSYDQAKSAYEGEREDAKLESAGQLSLFGEGVA